VGWFWWFIRWLRGLPDPWAGVADPNTAYYFEGSRRMTIAGQMLADGFEICVASIVTWDDSKGELISASERERILRNVKSLLEAQGARVVLN
jgi:hypothetical protein